MTSSAVADPGPTGCDGSRAGVAIAARGLPQLSQNLLSASTVAPQLEQIASNSPPHSRQNRAPSRFSAWHRGQFTSEPSRTRDHRGAGTVVVRGEVCQLPPGILCIHDHARRPALVCRTTIRPTNRPTCVLRSTQPRAAAFQVRASPWDRAVVCSSNNLPSMLSSASAVSRTARRSVSWWTMFSYRPTDTQSLGVPGPRCSCKRRPCAVGK
jgi:hypothetical protein